jgi:hypothetical protein
MEYYRRGARQSARNSMYDRIETTTDRGTDREASPERLAGVRPGRRAYLKTLGAFVAGGGLLTASGRGAAASFDSYELDENERFERRIGDDEQFTNVLIDASADGATIDIRATGSDWEIRNVGVRGSYNGTIDGSLFTLQVDEGATGVFENVYLGDGGVDGGYAGAFVPTAHAGELTISQCYIAGWPDNGVYASAPGRDERDGQDGTVRVDSSFAMGNNVAGFRVGTDGSVVRDSVVVVRNDVPANTDGAEYARGIWVREGATVDIENCDVLLAHSDGSSCVRQSDGEEGLARVIDSQIAARGDTTRFRGNVETENVGDDPDLTLPDGVPDDAETAASGDSSSSQSTGTATETDGDTSDGSTRTIRFGGGESKRDEYLEYSLTAGADLAGRGDTTDSSSETPDGGQANGTTGGAEDKYTIEGGIESLEATLTGADDQSARLVIDADDSQIQVAGGTDDQPMEYKLETTGSDETTRGTLTGDGDTLQYDDSISLLRVAIPADGKRFFVKIEPV